MALTLQEMRDEVRRQTGTDESDLPDAVLDQYLNRSWWEIADKYKFREKEKSIVFDTVAGTREYDIVTDIGITSYLGIQLLSLLDPATNKHIVLRPINVRDYEASYQIGTDFEDVPTHYLRRDTKVILHPTPKEVYSITVYYWVTLDDIASIGVPIPQSWDEIIIYGAVARAHEAITSDLDRADRVIFRQSNLIETAQPTQAKEKYDWHSAQLRAIRPPYRV